MGLGNGPSSIAEVFENKNLRALGVIIGILGIAYLLWKIISLNGDDLTFKYLWFAGSLWQDGLNPYGDGYIILGQKLFESFNGQPLYYPPNWWPISNLLALFEYEIAMEIWRFGSATAIITATLFLNEALKKIGIKTSKTYLIFYTGLVCFMQATVIGLSTGQTAIAMYFAFSLFIYAAICTRPVLLSIGLCILLLKPQLGVPLFFALLPFRRFHLELLYTCALTFLFILPAAITIGPLETLLPYLKGLAQYSTFAANDPLNSTGLKKVIVLIVGADLSSSVATLLSIIAAVFIGFYYSKRQMSKNSDRNLIGFFITLISLTAFVAPLHEYDLIIVAPIMFLAKIYPINFQIFLTLAFLVLMRCGNIADLFAPTTVDEARYYTATVATFALIVIIAVNSSFRRKT